MNTIERLVEVKGLREGSGLLLTEGLVLTSWHLLRPGQGEEAPNRIPVRLERDVRKRKLSQAESARLNSGSYLELPLSTVVWPVSAAVEEDWDYALLRLVPGPHRKSEALAPVTWASLQSCSRRLEVSAYGYPDLLIDRGSKRRDIKGITGWIEAADSQRALSEGRGSMTFYIAKESVPRGGVHAWEAMSGAPVFFEDILIGVVRRVQHTGETHSFEVLPVDRLFESDQVKSALAQYNLSLPDRVSLPEQVAILPQAAKELAAERLSFRFEDAINLTPAFTHALEAYAQDLEAGHLSGFRFTTANVEIADVPGYVEAKSRLAAAHLISRRRTIDNYERMMASAFTHCLNMLYLGEKQNLFCYQSCFWLARSIRCAILFHMSSAGIDVAPLVPKDDGQGEPCLPPDPLNYFVWNKCYGSEMLKIDLWHPAKSMHTAAYIRSETESASMILAGLISRFNKYDLLNDFYSFIFPQMLLRHFIFNDPLIEDWRGFRVGPA